MNTPRRTFKLLMAGGGGGGTTTAGNCTCTCLEDGDITVGSYITTSRWNIPLTAQSGLGDDLSFGEIHLAAGTYTVVWNSGRSLWVLDIGSLLTATYNDGSDATADTTMDGELTMELAGTYSTPTIKLCVTGSVPDPGP